MTGSHNTPRKPKPPSTVLLDVSTAKYPNRYTLIDADLAERLSQIPWYINDKGYVRGIVDGAEVKLHRYILEAKDNEICDHINRNTLDNRRCNLRKVTALQNCMNRGPNAHRQYKGVYRRKSGAYEARIRAHGRSVYLGLHQSPESAARAYDRAAHVAFGEHAYLNFGGVEMSPEQQKAMRKIIRGKKRPYVRHKRMLGIAG